MPCPRRTKSKYTKRPGPPYPANDIGCRGRKREGNDGGSYRSVVASNGVYRWKKITEDRKPSRRSVGLARERLMRKSRDRGRRRRRRSRPRVSRKERMRKGAEPSKGTTARTKLWWPPPKPVSKMSRPEMIRNIKKFKRAWGSVTGRGQDIGAEDTRSTEVLRQSLRYYYSMGAYESGKKWLAGEMR